MVTQAIAMIGFGEAAQAFAGAAGWQQPARVFDIATTLPATAAAKHADYTATGVAGAATIADAVSGANIVVCLVTADQTLAATRAALPFVAPGSLWCDGNSVAPETKRAAAALVTGRGGRYVDLAIMGPVHPARLSVPLLLAGPDAAAGNAALATLGFTNRRIVAGEVGAAAAIKMLRSVIVKGTEALTAEAFAGAARAGLVDELLLALAGDWPARADYNLDRMLVHGARRAAEMDEVMATLKGLGIDAAMSEATARWQRRLGCGIAPDGLIAKLETMA